MIRSPLRYLEVLKIGSTLARLWFSQIFYEIINDQQTHDSFIHLYHIRFLKLKMTLKQINLKIVQFHLDFCLLQISYFLVTYRLITIRNHMVVQELIVCPINYGSLQDDSMNDAPLSSDFENSLENIQNGTLANCHSYYFISDKLKYNLTNHELLEKLRNVNFSNGSVNSHSRKNFAQKQFSAFYGIMFHFSSLS